MKRYLGSALALVLVVALLCGCTQLLPDQTVACGELTITIPGVFLDLSSQAFASEFEMVYGLGDQAVSILKEPVSDLTPYYPDIDAQAYAKLAVESNGLDSGVEMVDNIPTFTYTAEAEDMDFTYLVGVFQSDTYFYMVQCYCYSENFEKNEASMWEQITSVTIG